MRRIWARKTKRPPSLSPWAEVFFVFSKEKCGFSLRTEVTVVGRIRFRQSEPLFSFCRCFKTKLPQKNGCGNKMSPVRGIFRPKTADPIQIKKNVEELTLRRFFINFPRGKTHTVFFRRYAVMLFKHTIKVFKRYITRFFHNRFDFFIG